MDNGDLLMLFVHSYQHFLNLGWRELEFRLFEGSLNVIAHPSMYDSKILILNTCEICNI